jgi:hypothetical protein
MLLGIISLIVSSGGHVFAQGPAVDVGKLKQILNATRMAIEAYDMPGATTQLDMAEQVLTGGANMTVAANMTSAANMTNSTS